MSLYHNLQSFLPEKSQFKPPCCPNPKCQYYGKPPQMANWCRKIGSFTRKNGDVVPRWICLQGEKTHSFSYSSFECTYWLKRRDLLPCVAQGLSEQSSFRGLARSLKVSQNCIYSQAMRVGRHCLLLHQMALDEIDPQRLGTLVFDELESWEVSQFVPTTHPLFLDYETGFKLALGCAPINRKGRMTLQQRAKYKRWVQAYGKSPKDSSRKAVRKILEQLKEIYKNKTLIQVVSDKKKTYVSELKRSWRNLSYVHRQFDSKKDRHVGAMGKINQEDQYIRQRCATMRRENLDFMRRYNNTYLRHAIYLVKRNFVMANSGSKRKRNPAVKLGLISKPVSWDHVFSQRVINGVALLPDYLKSIYFQKGRTRFYKNNQIHLATYAL